MIDRKKKSAASVWELAIWLGAFAGAAPAEELSILSYNLWHGRVRTERQEVLWFPGESRSQSERRLDFQLELLRRERPDVVLLQEVAGGARRLGRYADALGYDAVHKTTDCGLRLFGLGLPLNLKSGLAILARPDLDLRPRGSLRLSGRWARCSGWFGFQLEEARYALLAEITVGSPEKSVTLLIANTHLHHLGGAPPGLPGALDELVADGRLTTRRREEIGRAAETARERRVREVETLLGYLTPGLTPGRSRSPAGVVLGGDFNALPGSVPIARVLAGGFVDAAEASRGGFAGPTYDPQSNPLAAWVGQRSGPGLPVFGDDELLAAMRALRNRWARRIDYVFVSSDLAAGLVSVTRLGVEPGEGAGPGDPNAPPPMASDHYGVMARLAVPGHW